MKQNPLVGTFRLVSLELRSEEGEVSYPLGQDAVGYIMYNEQGYMAVALMAVNRPKWAAGDMLGGSTEEMVAAVTGYSTYCGRYEIQGEQVIHHIELSLYPNWIGVDQARIFSFDGDRLSLSTPPTLIEGKQQTGYLIWERA